MMCRRQLNRYYYVDTKTHDCNFKVEFLDEFTPLTTRSCAASTWYQLSFLGYYPVHHPNWPVRRFSVCICTMLCGSSMDTLTHRHKNKIMPDGIYKSSCGSSRLIQGFNLPTDAKRHGQLSGQLTWSIVQSDRNDPYTTINVNVNNVTHIQYFDQTNKYPLDPTKLIPKQ